MNYAAIINSHAALRERIDGLDRVVLALVLRGKIDRADEYAAQAERLREQLAELEQAETPTGDET